MPAKRPSPTPISEDPVYRVDIFNVPVQARRRFLDRVEETHRVLRTIPGFIEDHILERPGGPDAYTIVTIAMWKDEEAVRQAKAVVGDWHKRTGFNPQKLMDELGVEAAIGEFRPVEMAMTV
jgi:heme-degrading monooxygenase HmoA